MYFSVILVLTLLYRKYHNESYGLHRRIMIAVASTLLFALASLRHQGVGIDTYAYMFGFESMKGVSWESLLRDFLPNYLGLNGYAGRDPGFNLLQKALASIISDGRFILIASSGFFYYSLGLFLYRTKCNLKQLYFFYIFYIVLFNGYIPNAAIRQTFAFSFVLLGYCSLINGNLKKFILWVIIGSFIHKTALLACVLAVLYYVKNVKFVYKVGFFAFAGAVLFYKQIGSFFLMGDDVYGGYITSSYYNEGNKPFMVVLLMAIFYLIILFGLNNDSDIYKRRLYYYGSLIAIVLTPLLWLDPSLLRLVVFFCPFLGLSVSHAIELSNYKKIIFIGLITILAMKSLSSSDYKFMWQDMELHERYAFVRGIKEVDESAIPHSEWDIQGGIGTDKTNNYNNYQTT